jgi:outer membrane protein assembly factor BamB
MKRFFSLFLVYTLTFLSGYLSLAVFLHFYKPKYSILPKKIELLIDDVTEWGVSDAVEKNLKEIQTDLLHEENHNTTDSIIFTDDYQSKLGIFCFRGNAQRNSPSRGFLDKKPTSLLVDWTFITGTDYRNGGMGQWGGGTGWTGQALLVQWPEKIKVKFKTLKNKFKNDKMFREVIVGSLCGNIYFLDFETGEETRPPLSINNPIKGTISLDPRLNGLLYVGQGVKNEGRFGSYVFDLFEGKEKLFRPGADYEATRKWGAFDSSPLVDFKNGYVFQPGENGIIYKAKIDPDTEKIKSVKTKYKAKNGSSLGFESSMAAWKNLGVFGDNGGNVFCLNLMTMKPIWYFDNEDDTDATAVIDIEKSKPYVYVCNEVDKQGSTGIAAVRKLDLKTGKLQWTHTRTCSNGKVNGRVNSGGILATVLVGKQKAKNLLFAIYSRPKASLSGEFVAIDKVTGKEIYTFKMPHFSWASPLDLYDSHGNCYVFFTDVCGGVYVVEALTGKLLIKKRFPVVWESSPIASGNRIILGSRGNLIWSFKLN